MSEDEAKIYNAVNVSEQSDYEALKNLYQRRGSWAKARIQTDFVGKEWNKLDKEGVRLVLKDEAGYPKLLKEIPWPPFGVYLKGELTDNAPTVAIVGTRKASARGKEIARNFAKSLSRYGITVISGLAMGIDEAAHKGVVEAGGKTVAVLATGLDAVYPRQNENLAKKILELGGALVSEYPLGHPSYPMNFVHRNRIISGLSLGVIVIEAPEKSGALATANFALEQNREVFVVPGPISDPNYVGSNKLIKAGAALITSVEDVLENLNLPAETAQQNISFSVKSSDKNEQAVLGVLKSIGAPAGVDKISELSKLETHIVNRLLSLLVIKGIIKESGGRYYIS